MAKLPTTYPTLLTTEPGGIPALAQSITQMFQRIAGVVNNPDFGATAARPTAQLAVGQTYFDTTLGKPVWWRGAVWVDAAGNVV